LTFEDLHPGLRITAYTHYPPHVEETHFTILSEPWADEQDVWWVHAREEGAEDPDETSDLLLNSFGIATPTGEIWQDYVYALRRSI